MRDQFSTRKNASGGLWYVTQHFVKVIPGSHQCQRKFHNIYQILLENVVTVG